MCGKNMNEEEVAWWKSVNEMLGSNPDQKNWDGGWSEVGEVQQAVRESVEVKKKVISEELRGGGFSRMNVMTGGDGQQHKAGPGDSWSSLAKKYYGDETYNTMLHDFNRKYYKNMGQDIGNFGRINPGMVVYIPDRDHFDDRIES